MVFHKMLIIYCLSERHSYLLASSVEVLTGRDGKSVRSIVAEPPKIIRTPPCMVKLWFL